MLNRKKLRIATLLCSALLYLTQTSLAEDIVGFERAKAGTFKELATPIGTWKRVDGQPIIDNQHAKTGKQCLQLPGGERTSVTLDIAKQVEAGSELTFWAERWTKRDPFTFRVEKQVGEKWKEIFNGDREIKVGRPFLSHVKVPLGSSPSGKPIQRLRFGVTSPANTGILIDDIRIAQAKPQQVANVEVVPHTLPVLVGIQACPLLKLQIETTGQLNPISLSNLTGTLAETTDLEDIESLLVCRASSEFKNAKIVAKIQPVKKFQVSLTDFPLAEGVNHVWIACQLKATADVDHGIGAACRSVSFSNGRTVKLQSATSVQRLGVAVRSGGDDGVHTFRIPGLATTNAGTLIGVYDVRHRFGGDLPGDIDVGMSRSTDGGRSWEPMKVILDMGDDPKWRYDGVGDPAILVDKNTGTIWVAGTWSHGDRSWRGSGPGMTPTETGQLMLVRSDDDGVTWSEPINITSQVKRPEWCFVLQGPGKGITMRDGTIVFAAQYQDPADQKRLPHSTIIYSKDHGKTWQAGTGAFDDTTEAQVVEVQPNVLMLNCRYNRQSVRAVMTTRDMGKTWQKHTTSLRSLIEPRACMASLIDVAWEAKTETEANAGGWLLFSNPDSTRGRNHITIKSSPDRGSTWPKSNRILLDEGGGRGYSCLTMIDDVTVGILYEGSQADMTFQRVPLKELTGENLGQKLSPK